MNWNLSDALRAVSAALQTPVILILLLLIAVTIVMLGTLIAELFTERLHMKARLPELLNALEKPQKPLSDVISESALLKRQKKALLTVCAQTELSERKREALAVELLESEKARYDLRVKITDLVMKLGPMFGLLGTLIPLGPGLIGLGQGDTKTLSESLLIAFDTTVAGLVSGAVAFVISAIRKSWYEKYVVGLETIMECILDVQDGDLMKR